MIKAPTQLLPEQLKNLHLICWPQAGGTDPNGIRMLLDQGVEVSFCDNLHSKVYYCEGKGVIIGSANLSTNAMFGTQHEFGVYIEDANFDIQGLLRNLGTISPVTAKSLAKLDREHNVHNRRNPRAPTNQSGKSQTFQDAMSTSIRKRLKIVTYSHDLSAADLIDLESGLRDTFGSYRWSNYNGIEESHFREGDFVLQVEVGDEDGRATNDKPRWLFVDHIAKIPSTHVLIELKKTQASSRPFKIDKPFEDAFRKAFNSRSWPKIVDSS
jgi:hypothetical protein